MIDPDHQEEVGLLVTPWVSLDTLLTNFSGQWTRAQLQPGNGWVALVSDPAVKRACVTGLDETPRTVECIWEIWEIQDGKERSEMTYQP